MDQADLQMIRDRYRLAILERLVLMHALTEPVMNGHLSMQESQTLLNQHLDKQAALVGPLLGRALGDPALVALYGEEMGEVVEEMKVIVSKIANVAG